MTPESNDVRTACPPPEAIAKETKRSKKHAAKHRHHLGEVLTDREGHYHLGKVMLAIWTGACLFLILTAWRDVPNAVLGFLSGVELALVSWVAGPRVAERLAPAIAPLASALGMAAYRPVSEKVRDRRDLTSGIEESR